MRRVYCGVNCWGFFSIVSVVTGKKRKASLEVAGMPPTKRRKISFKCFEDIRLDILQEYKFPILAKNDSTKNLYWRCLLRHYKMSVDETRSFLTYYNNSDSVTEEEVEQVRSMEMLYRRFVDIYGLNEIVHCKDCSETERRRICHPV